ncbi:MAG: L,D-transpeptidase family protein [Actinomycetota bacterium]|nr:L,D-transpeptidase family protein [Actinomycetota bacterium]
MRAFWRSFVFAIVISAVFAGAAGATPSGATEDDYIVIVKDEQRLYLAQGDPDAPATADVIKEIPVTTGALWTQRGLETISGVFTVLDKSNRPGQGGYDFSDTGDVTLTPYFIRLKGSIGIHTYKGKTLDIWRFGATGGQTTHGCIAGPFNQIKDLYENYVVPGRTKVWVVDHASEAFGDVPAPPAPEVAEVDGKAWQALPSPTKHQFYSVDMVRPDLGWAIAGNATVVDGKYGWETEILKWDGERWALETRVPYWLNSLNMLDESEGWAVGQNYMAGVRYKNGKWTKIDRPIPRVPYMSDIAVLGPDRAVMTGQYAHVFTWDGAKWSYDEEPDVIRTLRSISVLESGNGWSVGGTWDTGSEKKETIPIMARIEGDNWTPADSPVPELLYGVQTLSEDDAWAVGSNGAIIHWDGEGWKSIESPTKARLSSIAMSSPNDGWIVGDEKGEALHWDGRAWSRVRLPIDEKFYDVSVLPDGTAMAVGRNGAIVRLGEASEQEAAPSRTAEQDVPATPDAAQAMPGTVGQTGPYVTAVPAGTATPITDNPARETVVASGAQQEVTREAGPAQTAAISAEAGGTEAGLQASANKKPASGVGTPAEQPEKETGGFPIAPVAVVGALAAAVAGGLALARGRM